MAPAAVEERVSAKDEIAEYLAPTRFGKDKPRLVRDKPVARPLTRGEALRQIKDTYRFNDWKARDEAANSRDVGLEPKPLTEYTNEELKIILGDFDRRGMILFEK